MLAGIFNSTGLVQIQIIDENGRMIRSFYEKVSSGLNSMLINNLNNLQPGIYFIKAKDGKTIRRAKFIKAQ
jgi:hypothetical protein